MTCSESSKRVDLRSDRLAVHWIDATRVSAEVVVMKPGTDRATEQLIEKAMRPNLALGDLQAAISVLIVLTVPKPAFAQGFHDDGSVEDDSRPEPRLQGASLPLPAWQHAKRVACLLPTTIVKVTPFTFLPWLAATRNGAESVRRPLGDRQVCADIAPAFLAGAMSAAVRAFGVARFITIRDGARKIGMHRVTSGVMRTAVTAARPLSILPEYAFEVTPTSTPAVGAMG